MNDKPMIHDQVDGCPEDSAEHWRDLYRAMSQHATDVNTRYSRLLQQQVQRERDVYAAAKRAAWDQALFNTELYVKSAVTRELYRLAYTLTHLENADRPTKGDVLRIELAARDLKNKVTDFKVEEPGRPLAEVRRLREALYAQGRRLHAEYGPQGPHGGERCGCPGCELTRAAELHEVADETTTVKAIAA